MAQLDYAATRARRASVLILVAMGAICPTAIIFLGYRINQKSLSDDGGMAIPMILTCVWLVATGVWQIRRSVEKDILPASAGWKLC